MLLPELKKLKEQLESKDEIYIDKDKLLAELVTLENVSGYSEDSLSLSGQVCPTCGRSL